MKQAVEKLNFSLDIDQLRDYYNQLQTNYKDHIWRVKDVAEKDEFTAKRVAASIPNYGWAITTEVLDENSKSNPPWPEVLNEFSYAEKSLKPERITELSFGIIKELLEKIPYAYHVILSVFPPGGATIPHTDQDFLLRVHVPIFTNKDVVWLADEKYHNMHIPGQAYICDTRIMHAAYNDSKEDRVHLIFAVKQDDLDKLRKISGVIKV